MEVGFICCQDHCPIVPAIDMQRIYKGHINACQISHSVDYVPLLLDAVKHYVVQRIEASQHDRPWMAADKTEG